MSFHDIVQQSKKTFVLAGKTYFYYDLNELDKAGIAKLDRLPYSIRILLENMVRAYDQGIAEEDHVLALARWETQQKDLHEIPFMPSRVILQDFTGVPAVVDLAAIRSAVARAGGDPGKIHPLLPVDLVIDHSVQVDVFGTAEAFEENVKREFQRNGERYVLLKWAQKAFQNFRVVPPGTGIVHQVNLEFLAKVVQTREKEGLEFAFPDTLIGTDSHTTMINGLGVLGWGVGGIEAEAVILGQPYFMPIPEVIGVRLIGTLPEGATATDLVLTITHILRKYGVVGRFVEYFGPGLDTLALPDRATVANMSPEYGATMGFFPVDEETLRYLTNTNRPKELVQLVDQYCRLQRLFRSSDAPEPDYTDVIEINLGEIEPVLAGPRNPEEKIPLRNIKERYEEEKNIYRQTKPRNSQGPVKVSVHGKTSTIDDGFVAIAAITSCTNTSNPSVMIGAGLLAKKAVEHGLSVPAHVKTSLAPGSRVVTEYLESSGLLPYLEKIGFYVVGYGCTTCIGNSGPLPEPVAEAVKEHDLIACAVLSGNRNFEGRVHPLVRFNFLGSPLLVVAYALAGRFDVDLFHDPIGYGSEGKPVYLRDIWPAQEEVQKALHSALSPELFEQKYGDVFRGPEPWQHLRAPESVLYDWDPHSTYIQEPPFFKDFPLTPPGISNIVNARILALFGDRITTDHISPAGAIPVDSPAGKYLVDHGVKPFEFNSFGSRRGNHEVMMRGTFGNIRIRNKLTPDREGGWTIYWPEKRVMTIYDAAMNYMKQGTPLVVIAGKQYGTGSSRDWAAKGTALLGVRAVLAESFERIHRSNLVGMGVLPLQFLPGESSESHGIRGHEIISIHGLEGELQPRQRVKVKVFDPETDTTKEFEVLCRLDTHVEIEYVKHGGILQYVLRKFLHDKD